MARMEQDQKSLKPWRHELRATFALAWPLVFTNLTMAAIGATDVIMIGRLGATELAGASLGLNLNMILAVFAFGLITATSPMMATAIGRKLNLIKEVRRSFRQGLWATIVIIIPLWIILWNTEFILLTIGQIPELAALAQEYVRAYMWCQLPFLWLIIIRNYLSAVEKPLWSLTVGIGGVIANILFNYALIFGNWGMPALGLTGAGIASILSNSLMFLAMVVVVMTHRHFRRFHLFGNFWRPDWPRFRQIWILGLPIAMSFAMEGGVFSVAVLLMGLIDTESVAAHAIAIQVASLTFMIPFGLSQAATVRVGIGFGRQDQDMISRAGWSGFAIGVMFMAAMAVLIWSVPELLIAGFIDLNDPDNANVIRLAVGYLLIAAIFQIFDGAQAVGQGMLRGLHDTRVPMFIVAFGYWVIGIGVGIWLAFYEGWRGQGLWIGLATGLGVVAVLMLTRWMMRDRLGLLPE